MDSLALWSWLRTTQSDRNTLLSEIPTEVVELHTYRVPKANPYPYSYPSYPRYKLHLHRLVRGQSDLYPHRYHHTFLSLRVNCPSSSHEDPEGTLHGRRSCRDLLQLGLPDMQKQYLARDRFLFKGSYLENWVQRTGADVERCWTRDNQLGLAQFSRQYLRFSYPQRVH